VLTVLLWLCRERIRELERESRQLTSMLDKYSKVSSCLADSQAAEVLLEICSTCHVGF
jgi:hypothetical protein